MRINNLLVFVALWCLSVFVFVWWWEIYPKTLLGGILLFTVGPVIFVIIELLGEKFHNLFIGIPIVKNIRGMISNKTRGQKISALRIEYLFFEFLIILLITIGIGFMISKHWNVNLEFITDFLKKNYK